MAGKLTEEQRAEIVRRHEIGETQSSLASSYGVTYQSIGRLLRVRNVKLRTRSEACVLAHGGPDSLDLLSISCDRWRELYWGMHSGYPSVEGLSRQLGLSPGTVRRLLIEAGVRLRTPGEQRKVEYSQKRWIPKGNIDCPGRWRTGDPDNPFKDPLIRKRAREALNRKLIQQTGQRISRPCSWCGDTVLRYPCRVKRPEQLFYCNGLHKHEWQRHWAHSPDQPRPLIVGRLRFLRESLILPNGIPIAHPTYEQLEKLAATIGAGDPEILAVMLETR